MPSVSRINLIPKEDFERTTLGRIMKWALTSFRFIVIAVELVVISGFLLRFWLDIQISDLDDEINQKAAFISSKSSFEKEFRTVQQKLDIFSQITAPENVSLKIFEDVSASLPADAQLTSFTRQANTLLISGATLSEDSISAFITNLKAQDRISSVVLRQITAGEAGPLIEFDLEVTLL